MLKNILLSIIGISSAGKRLEFVEKAHYEQGFRSFYNEHLRGHLLRAEQTRLYYASIIGRRLLILILATIIGVAYEFFRYGSPAAWHIILAIAFWAGGFAWALWPMRYYNENVKRTIFTPLFKFMGDFSFHPRGSLNFAKFMDSGIVPEFAMYHGEDYIEGYYEGISIEVEEIFLRSGTVKSPGKQVFHGLYILLDCPVKVERRIMFMPEKRLLPPSLSIGFEGVEPLKLPFEIPMEVYAASLADAQEVITAPILEQCLALGKLYQPYARKQAFPKVLGSFWRNKLLLMVPCQKDLFEPTSVFQPLDTEDLHLVLAQMNILFKIAALLKRINT